jgi:predicted DNA-binding protein YlxM (UPF0122 family)
MINKSIKQKEISKLKKDTRRSLTDDQVQQVKTYNAEGYTLISIADAFNVSHMTIQRSLKRKA